MRADLSRRVRVDYGRLVLVPIFTITLVADVAALAGGRSAGPLRWLSDTLTCLFYALIIWCYLRRGPATATSRSVTGHVAAVAGTFAPLLMPLLRGGHPGQLRLLAADLLLTVGLAWSLWSLRTLSTNLSVLAQARSMVTTGPYRLCRHPLYTGEIISSAGLAVAAGTAGAAALWIAFCGLQAYRAVREEQLLAAALPGYADYRRRTSALLPGLRLLTKGRARDRTSDAYTTTLLR